MATKIIPNIAPDLAEQLSLRPDQKSLALLTTDCDDVGYTAVDEATKKADVKVVYAKSLYGGAANANTKLAGEFIGILAGPNRAEVKAGLQAAVDMVENVCHFVSANEDGDIVYYAHCISRTGSYLSEGAGIWKAGAGLSDCASAGGCVRRGCCAEGCGRPHVRSVRAARRTNFGGALLTGSQSACKSACEAFADAVEFVAEHPLNVSAEESLRERSARRVTEVTAVRALGMIGDEGAGRFN